LASGRNPLPFPDRGSRIFAAASPEAKAAIVEVFARNGLRERFRFDTDGVLRSILFDGTIINWSAPDVTHRLRHATSTIGLVADDPVARAEDAAAWLRSHGSSADVVRDAEPGLPVVFLLTDAMPGKVLNVRQHVIQCRVRRNRRGVDPAIAVSDWIACVSRRDRVERAPATLQVSASIVSSSLSDATM